MKAGTTSLHRYLGQHPQIFMSPVKEPQYFSFGDIDDISIKINPRSALTLTAYCKLFEGVGEQQVIGEASTTYLDSPRAARRIKKILPEARMIAVLRDPAERAHSHYVFNRKQTFEDAPTFAEALERESQNIASRHGPRFAYRGKGFYYQQLTEYFRLFDRDQFRIFLYEDFKEKPDTMLHEVFGFLEVNQEFKPDTRVKYNVSGVPRNHAAEMLLRTLRPASQRIAQIVPPRILSRVGRKLIRPQSESAELRRAMIELYREDILRLEDLIDRDLTAWRQ